MLKGQMSIAFKNKDQVNLIYAKYTIFRDSSANLFIFAYFVRKNLVLSFLIVLALQS